MTTVNTQLATSKESDFEENTWTFLMPKGFQVWAGQFVIMDKPVYDKAISVLQEVYDSFDGSQIPDEIFKEVKEVLSLTQLNKPTTNQ